MTQSTYLIKKESDIKLIKSGNKNLITLDKDYIGKITIKPNEEYLWNYNNYFKENKFIKPYDALDWVVIGPSRLKNLHKLTEGDFIKLGKLVFFVRKIKIQQNENLNETKRNSSIDNSELNLGNNINEDIIIHNKNNFENFNYIETNKELIENGANKINNLNLITSANNRLKNLYMKLKTLNKKQKVYKCRICFCEGGFDGLNPLISPCKCSGSVKYIHLNCLRKWLTTKILSKVSSNNDIYCYVFKSLKCEICQSIIPEIAEFRGKFLSLLDFKNIDPPYIILQSMYQYNSNSRNLSDLNVIFVIGLKLNGQVLIGRSNISNIRLSDVSVSRNHAKLKYLNGEFFLEDIGSKFGTLLLIQNDILFLPYKDIKIQTGRSLLIFKLKRTCLGLFKCYKNKLYNNNSYLDKFINGEKKVYKQILETFNKNVIDPIEKFSSISGSCTPSKKSSVTIEENKINETSSNNDKEKSEEKNDENEDENINKKLNISNGQEKNEILIDSNIKEENKDNNIEYKIPIPIFNLNIDKLNKDILIEKEDEIEEQKKQNESHEMFINENEINLDKKNKNIFSKLNVMNFLNKKELNKRSISVVNNKQKINIDNNLQLPQLDNKNINNDLAMTQREFVNKNKIILEEEKKK